MNKNIQTEYVKVIYCKYINTYMYIGMQWQLIKIRSNQFENEQEGVYERAWREEMGVLCNYSLKNMIGISIDGLKKIIG